LIDSHKFFIHTLKCRFYGIFLTIVVFNGDERLIDVDRESVGRDLVPVDIRDPQQSTSHVLVKLKLIVVENSDLNTVPCLPGIQKIFTGRLSIVDSNYKR
jgi:hypothetical protein